MEEKNHMIDVLQQTSEAIKNKDVSKLKELSNQTIHTASTHKDTDSISVAVIIYSLGKILEREEFQRMKGCTEFCQAAGISIGEAISSLKKNDSEGFKNNLDKIMTSIKKLSPSLRKDVEDVFIKAKINKASKIYEHGISMEQTAKLLGVTMFDIAGYAGQRGIADTPETKTVGVKERIKYAMDIFG